LSEENSNLKVLIVEDDENLRKFMKLIIENKYNFPILEASDGKSAMEILSKEIPFLILLDLMLPEISGIQLLEEIRKKDEIKNVPVIVCTSVSDRNVVIDLVRLGITEYLLKPITPAQLVNKINELLTAIEDRKLTK
jgi:DNA-binding response OmpR family regulator